MKDGGMLILLWGIVAHEVDGVLPYFSPHVHSWTHVHSTAHSVGGCPDQLYKEGNKRMLTQAIAEFDGHSDIQKSEPPSLEPRFPVSLFPPCPRFNQPFRMIRLAAHGASGTCAWVRGMA